MGEAEIAAGFAAASSAKKLTILNYSYSDQEQAITVRIKLDEALFEGAASRVTSKARHLRVVFDDLGDDQKAVELRVAAPAAPETDELACWVLRLAPLFRAVLPEATE